MTKPTSTSLGTPNTHVLMRHSLCSLERIAEMIADHVMACKAAESALEEQKRAHLLRIVR